MTSVIRRGDPQRKAYWQEVVRRWKESGRSVRDFCRAEGLRESAFFFWRRKLEHRDGSRGMTRKPRAGVSQVASGSKSPELLSPPPGGMPSFLPVRVTAPESACPNEAAGASQGVEIVLGQGRTVRVQIGFDRETLVKVLAVLEGLPC